MLPPLVDHRFSQVLRYHCALLFLPPYPISHIPHDRTATPRSISGNVGAGTLHSPGH